MRYLYSFLFYLILPFLFLRLQWRSRRLPAYRQRLGERIGYYPFPPLKESIWIHSVSVGETLAAIPLIKAIKSHYATIPIVITTMTPTGAARVKAEFGDSVLHAYIPYDVPIAVRRFLSKISPRIGIIMETELWPNLLAACHKKNIPLCLINARLSSKSAQGYARIASLTHEMLQTINVIAAQGEADAENFIALGAPRERISITGNIKFDLELPSTLDSQSTMLRHALGKDRFIWIAASTHEGEEEIVLAAHSKVCAVAPNALLILVPRHPDRFAEVAKRCAQLFVTTPRSRQEQCAKNSAVYLGDTMGELLLMYSVADVCFVGGSLIPKGGHNMLEPGAIGKPILTGPYLFNFAKVSELLRSANALTQVTDADSLATQLIAFIKNPQKCAEMGESARRVVSANRGALARQLQVVKQLLDS